MRMWGVPPGMLCRRHLLGEHVEMHMFAGCISRGRCIEGYIRGGLVDVGRIRERHDALAAEMVSRGYRHESPLDWPEGGPRTGGSVDVDVNMLELSLRCSECASRMAGREGRSPPPSSSNRSRSRHRRHRLHPSPRPRPF